MALAAMCGMRGRGSWDPLGDASNERSDQAVGIPRTIKTEEHFL